LGLELMVLTVQVAERNPLHMVHGPTPFSQNSPSRAWLVSVRSWRKVSRWRESVKRF